MYNNANPEANRFYFIRSSVCEWKLEEAEQNANWDKTQI